MKQKIINKSYIPALTLILLAFIWGSSFILIKKGLEGFSATQVGTLRVTVAFFVMLPIALKSLKTVYKENWRKIIPYALLANLFPALLFAMAETGLSSSITGVLNALTPIFTLLTGAMFFTTLFTGRQIFGLIIGFAGSALLSLVSGTGEFGSFNYYALYVVVATLCYGITANMVKVTLGKINSLVLTSLAMFSIGPPAIIYLLTTDLFTRLSTSTQAWYSLGYIAILGSFGTAFALVLFNRLVQNTSAVFASTVTYLIPIIAVFWGLADGENLFVSHYIGIALVISGVYVVNKKRVEKSLKAKF